MALSGHAEGSELCPLWVRPDIAIGRGLPQVCNAFLPEGSIAKKIWAERVGFEPTVRIDTTTAFETAL